MTTSRTRTNSSTTTAERTVLAVLAVAGLLAAVWVGLMVLTVGSFVLSG
ncbi:hypothetical protein [Streptomyces sp. NPDC050738]